MFLTEQEISKGLQRIGELRRAARAINEMSDVRPEKVARAKKLVAKRNYPSKRVIADVGKKIARYF